MYIFTFMVYFLKSSLVPLKCNVIYIQIITLSHVKCLMTLTLALYNLIRLWQHDDVDDADWLLAEKTASILVTISDNLVKVLIETKIDVNISNELYLPMVTEV